jgi:O-antigen/teichoic acid export membrane protein
MLRFNGLKTSAFKDLIQAGGILFIASGFGNLCNLLFWLFMVRKLNPVEYGILNTLFSLFMILSLPAGTLQTVITKFVAQLYALGKFAQIKYFITHFSKRVFLIAIFFLALFVLFSPAIASFLRISSVWLILVTGVVLFISIVSPLTLGVLQGAQRFLAMSVNSILNSVLRLTLGIALVAAGFKAMGALVGFGMATVLTLAISFFQIPREVLIARTDAPAQLKMNSVYRYSLPVFFSLLCWMILTNVDVILVKHFFSPLEAGFYSIAQMAGKIILFLPGVVSVILFPKMSEAFSQQKSSLNLLKKGLAITSFLCATASILCVLYPDLVLRILTKRQDAEAIKLIVPFCVAMTFYALVNLFIFYNLAIQRFRFTFYLSLVSLLQISLISLFHPNLAAVLFSLILCSSLLFFMGSLEAFMTRKR